MKRFTIGIDYGTESGRVLLADVQSGEEVAVHVVRYPHGVIESTLPGSNVKLPRDFALQHPEDYLYVLTTGIRQVLQISGVDGSLVIGIGIDFTACTMLPIEEQGTPLCLTPKFRDNPHSWVKLWKHHAAEAQAIWVTESAKERGESFLARYGGKISSEWMIPKILEILNEAPDVYDNADKFVEAADWVILQLSGRLVRNRAGAGYKGMWHDGFPDEDYFSSLHPRLKTVTGTKLSGEVLSAGERVGGVTAEMAGETGLIAGTPVAVGMIDAHAAVPGTGVYEPGKLVMVMGTSTCHMLMDHSEQFVEGISGVVRDGILPGYYGYEAGQAAVGDLFGWFVQHIVSVTDGMETARDQTELHEWLEREASRYRPGETGLMALDWWNGNRSVLMDADLTGLLVGCTLATRPPEIYRALLESTAFGTRKIIENFVQSGIDIHELYACGGLPKRNRLLMQIYADVTNRTIKVPRSNETGALGSAICGAVAAGSELGGYDSMKEAIQHMTRDEYDTYVPNADDVPLYNQLYETYLQLHDYFGREASPIMKGLKRMSKSR